MSSDQIAGRGERLGAMYLDWALIGEPPFFAFGDKGPKDGLAEHPHRRATGRIRLGQSNLPKAMRQQMHLHSRKGKRWRWSRTM